MLTKVEKNIPAIIAISVGILELMIDYVGIDHPAWILMQTRTAIAFILAGIAFAILVPEKISLTRKILGKSLTLLLIIICIIGISSGHQVLGSGLYLTLIGIALFFLDATSQKIQLASETCSISVALFSFSGIFASLFGVNEFADIFTERELFFPKVRLLLLIVSGGILFSRPRWKFTKVFLSNSIGGIYFRKMSLRILIALIILSIIGKSPQFFKSFMISSNVIFQLPAILIFFYILWNSATDLEIIERAHKEELAKRLDFEKLFNLSFDMICIASPDGYFKYINAAFEKTLGYSNRELTEKSFVEFVHPDDRASTLDIIHKLERGEPSFYFENRYLAKSGDYKIFGWTSTWVKEEGLIFAVARDLTKIKKADEELRAAYKFVEVVLDNVPNMIFVKDAQELRFLRFNKAGEQLLGYPRSDLLGRNDYDFFPKTEADFFTSKDRAVLSGKTIVDIPEEPIHTKNRGERLLRTKKIPVYDSEGKAQYLVGISEDITDIKILNEEKERTQVALKSAERIRLLIQNSLDAVVGMNDKGLITSWNPQAEQIFGWTNEQAIGSNLANLIIPAEYRQAHREGIKKFLKESIGPILNNRLELVGLRRGQIEFPIELTVTPIKENNSWLFYAFVRDISDRKNFEKQQLALLSEEHAAREAAERTINMQDDFLSIAAHELRTPITPISMQLQLLERTLSKVTGSELTVATKQNLMRLIQNSTKEIDRLTRLIEELLDVTRISAGRLVLDLEEVNLSNVIKVQIERYNNEAAKAGSTFETLIPPNIIGHWDLMRIESMVQNLITNAIKYGNGKQIEIALELKDSNVLFKVKDYGIGIPKEDQSRIFKKFERAASVKDYSGLGLGLYITSEIVKAHSGTIYFESEPAKGSTFLVQLPLTPHLLS